MLPQRTTVWFSEPAVTSAPGDPTPFSGIHTHLYSCMHARTPAHTLTRVHKIKFQMTQTLCICLVWFFETWSHSVSLGGLEFDLRTRTAHRDPPLPPACHAGLYVSFLMRFVS